MTAHPSESIFWSITTFGVFIRFPSRRKLFIKSDNEEGRQLVQMIESSSTRERAEMLPKFEVLASW